MHSTSNSTSSPVLWKSGTGRVPGRRAVRAAVGLLALAGTLLATAGPAHAATTVFTVSGTYTVPAGVTQVTVTTIGAGSGGGAGGSALLGVAAGGGGGGGGGGTRLTCTLPVTAGQNLTVIVGAGGTGGAGGGLFAGPDGESGGNTSVRTPNASVFAVVFGGSGVSGGYGGQNAVLLLGPGLGGPGGFADGGYNCPGGASVSGSRGANGASGTAGTTGSGASPGTGGSGGAVAQPLPAGCPASTGKGGNGGNGSNDLSVGDPGTSGGNGCAVITTSP